MNLDPLKSDLGDLITPDPDSTADKSSAIHPSLSVTVQKVI